MTTTASCSTTSPARRHSSARRTPRSSICELLCASIHPWPKAPARTTTFVRSATTRASQRSPPRARPSPGLHSVFDEADHVALGIAELAELDHVHDLLRAHDPLATEALGLGEGCLDVGNRDVEGDVAFVAGRPAGDAAADARIAVGREVAVARHHPVVHLVVGVDLPVEELGVVLPQLVSVLANDLEVDYRLTHVLSFRCTPTKTAGRQKTHRREWRTSRAPAGTATRG